jgi:hypothetical protein
VSSGSDTLLNRENYSQLVHDLDILDKLKRLQETHPGFGDKQVHDLTKELDVCMSVVEFMDCMNTSFMGNVTTFLVNFIHLQQL